MRSRPERLMDNPVVYVSAIIILAIAMAVGMYAADVVYDVGIASAL